MTQRALALLACALLVAELAAAASPNLVVLLVDDYGWGNVGFHRTDGGNKEVATPNIDALAAGGVKLDRFYAYRFCSPSRCSLQTGRLPVHVNVLNLAPEAHNKDDPVAGFAGIPPNMTTLATRLKQAGYKTVMTGKWDAGMALQKQTPRGRGYDHFLGYFHHANDYWTQGLEFTATGGVDLCLNRFKDLWLDDGPAVHLAGTAYEEDLFTNHTLSHILAHDTSKPLFVFHAFHLIHSPLQVPKKTLDLFSFIEYKNRQLYAAMVYYMDIQVGSIVSALRQKNMYDNTLILFFSDNGGPLYDPGSASNFPLRGGKFSDLEGGVRVNAFAAGGLIPSDHRGKTVDGLIHIADVYATLIGLAHGGSPSNLVDLIRDDEAARAGLPAVDSIDFWPLLSGQSGGKGWKPRSEIHLSSQALLQGHFKILQGKIPMNAWVGPFYPNATGAQPLIPQTDVANQWYLDCGPAGCLFNVFNDPTEHTDLALQLPELRLSLLNRLETLNKANFDPDRGIEDKKVCTYAQWKYQGFYGPFLGEKLFGEGDVRGADSMVQEM